MTTKRQQALIAIQQAGENGIRTDEIREATGVDRHLLNVYLWSFRNEGKIKSAKIGNRAVHVAAGVSIDKAQAALEADEAALQAERRAKHAAQTKEWKRKRDELKASEPKKPLSEAQLAQKRAAAEKGRQRQQELGMKPPKQQRKAKLIQVKTSRINKLAEKVKREKPSMMIESKPVPVATEDWSRAKVVKIPTMPGRYEVLEAEPVFTGQELLPPSSCMGRAFS